MKFSATGVIVTVSLMIFIFQFTGCGGSRKITDQDTVSFNNFAEILSLGFTDTVSSDTFSLRKRYLKEGLINVAQFLHEKDPDAFSELHSSLLNKHESQKEFREFIYKNYNKDFAKLGSQYYSWANSNAEKRYGIQNDYKSFKIKETENFIFIYNPQLSDKDINFLTIEAENVFHKLKNLFQPDISSFNNFKRLSVRRGWLTGDLKDSLGVLEETAGKIPVVITSTQQEMLDITRGKLDEANVGGLTTFSPVLYNNNVRFVCRAIINYSSPLSVVPLAHEIAHAFSFVVFSRPHLLDSLVSVVKPDKIQELGIEQIQPFMMRIAGITAEGLGHWAGWQTSVFSEAGILPGVHEQLLQRTDKIPDLQALLSGKIDLSFWDIVKAIFGSKPTDKIATFFIGSASFIDYLINNSSPEQLFAVFSGGQNELTPNELEIIYGRRFIEIESEWKNYLRYQEAF